MLSKANREFCGVLHDLHEDAGDGVLVFEGEKIVFCNEGACRMTGYSSDELFNIPTYLNIIVKDQRDFFRQRFEAWQRGESIQANYQAEFATKDDQYTVVEGVSRRITLDGKGYLMTLFHNITERERIKEELITAQKSRAVSRLVDGIIHDFGNYLMVINGQAQMLIMSEELPEVLKRSIEAIYKASQGAKEVISQVQVLSREESTEDTEPSRIDLNELVEETLPVIKTLISSTVSLELSLSDELEPVWANVGQLRRVLMNLCINAKDAMPDGGKLTIRTDSTSIDVSDLNPDDLSCAGDYSVLEVTDTGIGMDRETRRRLFDPFFTTKAPGKGTGLGLASVLSIIEQSGGLISVESSPGKGSSFEILLPVHNEGDGPE
jgi:two-component system cell cycle sensor histidine kinase/response regulator CckA